MQKLKKSSIPKTLAKKKETLEENLFMKTVALPLGNLVLVASEKAILALAWNKSELQEMGYPNPKNNPAHPLLLKAESQLREYFAGHRKNFDLPLQIPGTAFQKSVWKTLQKIPFGKTWTYQELAQRIGNPGAMRAVGNANGKNPLSIFIPCHRVIRANGEIGGYGGGQEKKEFLLTLENSMPKSES